MDERWLGDLDVYTVDYEPTSRDDVVRAVERMLDREFTRGNRNLHVDIRVYALDGQTASYKFREQAGSGR
jgi:hypothetical protein